MLAFSIISSHLLDSQDGKLRSHSDQRQRVDQGLQWHPDLKAVDAAALAAEAVLVEEAGAASVTVADEAAVGEEVSAVTEAVAEVDLLPEVQTLPPDD